MIDLCFGNDIDIYVTTLIVANLSEAAQAAQHIIYFYIGDNYDTYDDMVIVANISEAAQAAKIQIYLLGDLEFYVMDILFTKHCVNTNFVQVFMM